MTTFDAIKKVLTEDVPSAQSENSRLVEEIADFQETWKQFQAIKEQAQDQPPAVAGRDYRTA